MAATEPRGEAPFTPSSTRIRQSDFDATPPGRGETMAREAEESNGRRRSSRASLKDAALRASSARDAFRIAPSKPPRRGSDGRYVRPGGPPPVRGYDWDADTGSWVPGRQLLAMQNAIDEATGPGKKKTRTRKVTRDETLAAEGRGSRGRSSSPPAGKTIKAAGEESSTRGSLGGRGRFGPPAPARKAMKAASREATADEPLSTGTAGDRHSGFGSPSIDSEEEASQVDGRDRRYAGGDGEVRCLAVTRRGRACLNVAAVDGKYCNMHADYETNPPRWTRANPRGKSSGGDRFCNEAAGEVRCLAITVSGRKCAHAALHGTKYCRRHAGCDSEDFIMEDSSEDDAQKFTPVPVSVPVTAAKPGIMSKKELAAQRKGQKLYTGTDGEVRCHATTMIGRRCAYAAFHGTNYCAMHNAVLNNRSEDSEKESSRVASLAKGNGEGPSPKVKGSKMYKGIPGEVRCLFITERGHHCPWVAEQRSKYCKLHADFDTNRSSGGHKEDPTTWKGNIREGDTQQQTNGDASLPARRKRSSPEPNEEEPSAEKPGKARRIDVAKLALPPGTKTIRSVTTTARNDDFHIVLEGAGGGDETEQKMEPLDESKPSSGVAGRVAGQAELQQLRALEDERYHPDSAWQEPKPGDNETKLTLYEKLREPRPIPRGIIHCPIKGLEQELRCVICLGYIDNARVVRECLHRFCAHCIEKMLQQMGRGNECPICRVHIPSRRSLAPDPQFDKLIQAVLKHLPAEEASGETQWSAGHYSATPGKKLRRRGTQQNGHRNDSRTGNGTSLDSSTHHDDSTSSDASAPPYSDYAAQQSTGVSETPRLVKIVLLRHGKHSSEERLRLPFLKIAGDAPVKVLKSFLRQKLGVPKAYIDIFCLGKKPYKLIHFGQNTKLEEAVAQAKQIANPIERPRGDYVPLLYRIRNARSGKSILA